MVSQVASSVLGYPVDKGSGLIPGAFAFGNIEKLARKGVFGDT
jgi:hypothetical protein